MRPTSTRLLLAGGALSSVLYLVGIDVISPLAFPAYYGWSSQMVSELMAVGAPSRPLLVALFIPYNVLVFGFAAGTWMATRDRRAGRVTAISLAGYGVISTIGLLLTPMDLRGTLDSSRDDAHIVATIVMSAWIVATLVSGAFLGSRAFRRYTFATLAVVVVFGAIAGYLARPMPGPTPWLGLAERVNIYATMLWFIALAVTVRRSVRIPERHSAFKSARGEAAFLAAYDEAMKSWPVPYEEMEIPSRFGMTHVVASGPADAPPLVLLHGYWATLTMWTPNAADLSRDYRVYAIDVMGQPSRSVPGEAVRNAADYVEWLTSTLDGLRLNRVSLVGMSYGGWLALTYAISCPGRLQTLTLLSPAASFLPLVKQFSLRGMLMVLWPARWTVNAFMRWLGFGSLRRAEAQGAANRMLELMYLGARHFRIPRETVGVAPTVFSDDELRAMHVPTLLLIGEHEAIFDPSSAINRARRLLPDVDAALVPGSNHEMCFSQCQLVDRRMLDFLKDRRTERTPAPDLVVA